MNTMSEAQRKAWVAALRYYAQLFRLYTASSYSFERCKADAQNPEHEDHERACQLWLRYLEERIAG